MLTKEQKMAYTQTPPRIVCGSLTTHPTGDGMGDVTATVITLARDQCAIKGLSTMSSTLDAISAFILQFLSQIKRKPVCADAIIIHHHELTILHAPIHVSC